MTQHLATARRTFLHLLAQAWVALSWPHRSRAATISEPIASALPATARLLGGPILSHESSTVMLVGRRLAATSRVHFDDAHLTAEVLERSDRHLLLRVHANVTWTHRRVHATLHAVDGRQTTVALLMRAEPPGEPTADGQYRSSRYYSGGGYRSTPPPGSEDAPGNRPKPTPKPVTRQQRAWQHLQRASSRWRPTSPALDGYIGGRLL